MHAETKHVLVDGKTYEHETIQRSLGQIERFAQTLGLQIPHFLFPHVRREVPQIDDGKPRTRDGQNLRNGTAFGLEDPHAQ